MYAAHGGGQALIMHAKVAILLTSLLFVFEISFLPKYRVNYYIPLLVSIPVVVLKWDIM